ncbi:MAG: GAF domain-containing protein, partial [Ramlibacter sp.]|nr:GAF domain-containing protein [Ramlibacter sp.]
MSAVLKPAGEKDSEQAFYDSQMLPPDKRGVSFEALFFRQLQHVTTRIHETENVDQIMLEVSQDICKLLNADRLTLYAVNDDRTAIVSKIKTGLNTSRDLKLPISAQSIAGYVAFSKQPVNIADVYDDDALKRVHPTLSFLKEVDKRSGYRTKQMLVVPILDGEALHGVLQVINNKSDQPFGELEVEGAAQLCKTLATAIRQRMQKAEEGSRRKATKYDGLVTDGVLTADELQQCIQSAREEAKPVEHMLMAQFQIRPAQIGPSLAKFFGVPYEPFNSGRIRSEMLHGPLKRDFLVEQGWIPLEESPEGLVVMCVDPEAVRGSRIVPQVFPRQSKFAYKVTTQTEFEETLSQLYGAGAEGGTIDELLADLSAPIDDEGGDDSSLESAAADNELVKFVNKVIIDAYNLKASDIHIEPLPGKAKTGIRLRIDGSLQPYIEVPSHFRQALVTRLKIMCDLDISEKRKP